MDNQSKVAIEVEPFQFRFSREQGFYSTVPCANGQCVLMGLVDKLERFRQVPINGTVQITTPQGTVASNFQIRANQDFDEPWLYFDRSNPPFPGGSKDGNRDATIPVSLLNDFSYTGGNLFSGDIGGTSISLDLLQITQPRDSWTGTGVHASPEPSAIVLIGFLLLCGVAVWRAKALRSLV